jgi:coiled-coil domain-containing protein 130
MGVRYNAEKKKIGAYFSTPIYSFRCKCHLCDGWFEIQTDPKNTRYVVTSGARQKDEDWNPEENGGYAVHGALYFYRYDWPNLTIFHLDTDKEGAVIDPLAALEKTTESKHHMENVQKPRVESLQMVSEHYNSDPYSLSLKARKKFREEKKIDTKKRQADDSLKGRYALPAELSLVEDDAKAIGDAKLQWQQAQEERQLRESKRRKLVETSISVPAFPSRTSGSSSKSTTAGSSSALNSLRTRILQNTAKTSASLRGNSTLTRLPGR